MLLAMKQFKQIFSKKMLAILLLGFSSGLPLALTASLLQTWFRVSGVDLVSIGLLSLIGQPYAYKFIWAPLLDRFSCPFFSWLGHRRSWILTFQLIIIFVITTMASFNPKEDPFIIGALGLLLAIFSATQDIVIDAYRVNILTNQDRGLGTSLSIEGYRFANLLSSGLGLILAEHIGWNKTYIVMAAGMLLGIFGTLLASSDHAVIRHSNSFWQSVIASVKQLLVREKALYLLALIVLYKLSDVVAHALGNVFFLDLHFSLTEIGTINKVIGVIATLIGVMFAGILMLKINLYRALLLFGGVQGITNVLYVFLAIYGKKLYLAIIVVFIENICSGMGTSALVALLTGLCDKSYSATQFALLSSLTSVARIYFGSTAGWLVKIFGWRNFYLISTLMAVPSIILIIILKKQIMNCDPRNSKDIG